jgi:hypothetical protein
MLSYIKDVSSYFKRNLLHIKFGGLGYTKKVDGSPKEPFIVSLEKYNVS